MFEKEIEFKNLLTEQEYDKIQTDHFKNEIPMHLTNYYIDNDSLDLINTHLMLRIRIVDGKQLMTLKIPNAQHVVYEYSGEVDIDIVQNMLLDEKVIPRNIREQLEEHNIPVNNLNVQGSLITERFEKTLDGGLLVLDKCSYLREIDYELEFEAPDVSTGRASFTQILNNYGIVRREEIVKSSRFYDALKRSKGVT